MEGLISAGVVMPGCAAVLCVCAKIPRTAARSCLQVYERFISHHLRMEAMS